jgi:hypothetical protein
VNKGFEAPKFKQEDLYDQQGTKRGVKEQKIKFSAMMGGKEKDYLYQVDKGKKMNA